MSVELSQCVADTPAQEKLRDLLLKEDQHHLFKDWKAADGKEQRKGFYDQIATLDNAYPGGLKAYLASARTLLVSSAKGNNPLEGWTPSVPSGASLAFGGDEWLQNEDVGAKEVAKCAFVLVAGGLGERLGYSRIKVELPTETASATKYLEYYVKNLLALGAVHNTVLPLAIMVSGDTEAMTLQLLKDHNNFGAAKGQITLMKQEKVPALQDNDARIAADGPYAVQAKPHGHGDVHVLLHANGLVKKWASEGRKWVYFFQDTNALGFRPLLATLGVSKQRNLHCNFLTVPRLPGQAVGGVAKLTHDDGREMTLNVEYNQLGPLLKATVCKEGDVAGADGIHSPYPGNINQFVLDCQKYAATLDQTKGVMGEFVNPKYSDRNKTTFKKPARLECMMQDYPKVLGKGENVGFTSVDAWISFSPCKNATADAASKSPPACALSTEADQYAHCAEMLRWCGCAIEKQSEPEAWGGVSVDNVRPAVVLLPSFATSLKALQGRLPSPKFVAVTERSTLILEGDVTVKSLQLDGGLVVKCGPGASCVIDHCVATNAGFARNEAPPDAPEATAIRGYVTEQGADVPCFELASGSWVVTTDGAAVVARRAEEGCAGCVVA